MKNGLKAGNTLRSDTLMSEHTQTTYDMYSLTEKPFMKLSTCNYMYLTTSNFPRLRRGHRFKDMLHSFDSTDKTARLSINLEIFQLKHELSHYIYIYWLFQVHRTRFHVVSNCLPAPSTESDEERDNEIEETTVTTH